jgi:ammonia channel protein AmtB
VYFRLLWLLTVVILGGAGAVTYSREHAGSWLLVLILTAIPLRVLLGVLLPPWFALGRPKSNLPFPVWYFSICLTMFLYWQFWGWSNLALGASQTEVAENLEFFSVPLCFASRSFLITPARTLPDVVGILFGNAFFYAIGMFIVYRAVHARLNRNRITQMNLSGADSDE